MDATAELFEISPDGRMPGLALPFALLGSTAAFFSVLAIGAGSDAMLEAPPAIATAFAMVVGASLGVVLGRWKRLHDPFLGRDARAFRIAFLVVLAGAVIGLVLGVSTWGEYAVKPCSLGGAACGLVFLPSALFVFDAASRAARARLGTLVAEVDRRTVLASLLAVVSFAAAFQAPALALARYSQWLPPWIQHGASFVVGGAVVFSLAGLRRRDVAARAQLEAIAGNADYLDKATDHEPDSARTIDLGLGADRWARPAELATYRTTARGEVVLKGSLHDARRAIDEALRHRRRVLAFSILMLAASALSSVIGAFIVWLARIY